MDCNPNSDPKTNLSTKRYRVTTKENAVQYTIHCDYRNSISTPTGHTFGMFPMLIQSKYRIDEKRPMEKDGITEKKPWSELLLYFLLIRQLHREMIFYFTFL